MQDTKKTSRAGFRELQNGKINKTYLHSKILFFQLIYCHKYRKILCQINFQKRAVFGNYTICNLLQFHRPAVRPAAVKRLRRVPATRPARKLHFAISTPAGTRTPINGTGNRCSIHWTTGAYIFPAFMPANFVAPNSKTLRLVLQAQKIRPFYFLSE